MGSFHVLRVSTIYPVMSVGTTICMVRGVRVRSMRSMSGIGRNGTLTTTSAPTSATTTVTTSASTAATVTLPPCIVAIGTSIVASTPVVSTRASKRTYGMVSIHITTN